MKARTDVVLKMILLVLTLFLGLIALRPFFEPPVKVQAESARFDHVVIVSPVFLYKGRQGLLLADKRNGNVWFMPRVDESYHDPVFIMRLQLEKLDQAPN